MIFEEKIKKAITNKPFDRCLGCVEQAVKEIKKATDEEIENRIRKLGTEIVKCSKCGQNMFWIKTKNGKAAPITLKLINHFADCPDAKEFRKK